MPLLANGFITAILYDGGPTDIVVRYDREVVMYDYDDFADTWTDAYGGVFIL